MNENTANESQVGITERNTEDVAGHGRQAPAAPQSEDVDGHGFKAPVVPRTESDDVDGHGYRSPVAPSDNDDVEGHGYFRPIETTDDDVAAHSVGSQTTFNDDTFRPGRPGPHGQRSAAGAEDDVLGHVGFDDAETHLKR